MAIQNKNMKNINNILLDLDGTLTDPKEGITKSVQYALEQLSVEPPSMDELEWTIGPPLLHSFEQLLNTKDRKILEKAVSFYRDRYVDRCHIENKPYEGIDKTLASLTQQGFTLYLATSKPWTYAGKILEHFDLRHYFKEVHGSELDGTRDYKDELIAYIIQQHSLDPRHTLMIGDREYDIHGAKQNDVRSVGVTYGYGSMAELEAADPDALCHHHSDIIILLNKK